MCRRLSRYRQRLPTIWKGYRYKLGLIIRKSSRGGVLTGKLMQCNMVLASLNEAYWLMPCEGVPLSAALSSSKVGDSCASNDPVTHGRLDASEYAKTCTPSLPSI